MFTLYVGIDVKNKYNVMYLIRPYGSKLITFSVVNRLDVARQLIKRFHFAFTTKNRIL